MLPAGRVTLHVPATSGRTVELHAGEILNVEDRWRWITFPDGMFQRGGDIGVDERIRIAALSMDDLAAVDWESRTPEPPLPGSRDGADANAAPPPTPHAALDEPADRCGTKYGAVLRLWETATSVANSLDDHKLSDIAFSSMVNRARAAGLVASPTRYTQLLHVAIDDESPGDLALERSTASPGRGGSREYGGDALSDRVTQYSRVCCAGSSVSAGGHPGEHPLHHHLGERALGRKARVAG